MLKILHRKRNDLRNKIYDPKKIRIVLGNIYRLRPFKTMLHRDVGKITLHKEFTGNGNFDVALLRMVNALPTGAIGIAPIILRASALTPGTACVVSGWGEYSRTVPEFSDVLRSMSTSIVQNAECNTVWTGALPSGLACIGTFPKQVCSGDLGAPVVCARQLAGFISRDTTCSNNQTIITRVDAYKSWIDANGSWHVKANFLLIAVGVIAQSIRLVSA